LCALALSEVPMLSGADLLGHVVEFRDHRLPFLLRAASETGGFCRMRFFGKEFLYITRADLMEQVLVEQARCFDKAFSMRTGLYPLTGEGLFTSSGELWRRQRRLMAPLFQTASLAPYAPGMEEATRQAISAWPARGELDTFAEMVRITMTIAGRTLFDADTFDEADELGAALTTTLSWSNEAIASLTLAVQTQLQGAVAGSRRVPERLRTGFLHRTRQPWRWPGRRSREVSAALELINRRVQRMIDERRAAGLTRRDLLTRLLAARDEDGQPMSDAQVRDEVVTLFVAGHETTAAALSWALTLLARHPEVADAVAAEALALGPSPAWPADCARLPLTLRVIKEAMRLYPPVYMLTRQANQDVEIGGYAFPRATDILLSPYAVHRDPARWRQPERFDPDRFLPEPEGERSKMDYLPFATGPRVCLGQSFALMESQIILATLLARVRLAPVDEDERAEPSITLRSAARLRVEPRAADHARAAGGEP